MEEKFMTLHPDPGKSGVNISKEKYDMMRGAIIATLSDQGEMTFNQLGEAVKENLAGNFEGSTSWYYTTVKLDLEARGIVQRVGTQSPQRIRLANTES